MSTMSARKRSRSNSLATITTAPPNSAIPLASLSEDDEPDTASTTPAPATASSPEKHRMKAFKFGASDGRSSPKSSPAKIRNAQHRWTSSMPYGPTNTPVAPSLADHRPSLSKQRANNISSWLFMKLRRTHVGELAYALLFASCFVVFMSSLAGVGYEAPPPRSTPKVAAPAVKIVTPIRKVKQEALKDGPLRIADDDEDPVAIPGGRVLGQMKPKEVLPVVEAPKHEDEVHPEHPPEAEHRDGEGKILEPHDNADDLLHDSPPQKASNQEGVAHGGENPIFKVAALEDEKQAEAK